MTHTVARHHPRIGYTYVPNLRTRVPGEGGGFLIQTNSAGFRSNGEFAPERGSRPFRALLFGDSQTAGDGVSNADRYSDRLQSLLPNLEIFNFGLSGSGTDQHFLIYQEHSSIEHDLVIIACYVENIWRIDRRFIQFGDAHGRAIFYAKPYFEFKEGRLELGGIPVPKRRWTEKDLPADAKPRVLRFEETQFLSSGIKRAVRRAVPSATFRKALRAAAEHAGLKRAVSRLTAFQPVPAYNSADHPAWLLLQKILRTWSASSRVPVILMLIPLPVFVEQTADPRPYQRRFSEFSKETGCTVYDLLPDLHRYPLELRQNFWNSASSHLTPRGHEAIAKLLAQQISMLPEFSATGQM